MQTSIDILVTDPNTVMQIHDGATFLARRVKHSKRFSISAFIKAGSGHDPVPGIGHFYEHMPFGLSANFKDEAVFNYMLRSRGDISAYTSVDHTAFYGSVEKGNEKRAIFATADLSCRSIIADSRFYPESETIVDETANRAMGNDSYIGLKIIKAAYGDQFKLPVIGNEETIRSIAPNDLRKFFEKHYVMDNLIVAMEGDFEPEQVLDWAREEFRLPRGLRTPEVRPFSFVPQTHILPTDHEATRAHVIFKSYHDHPSVTTKEKSALSLLGQTLFHVKGMAMQELRFNRRLLYSIWVQSVLCENSQQLAHDVVVFDAIPRKVPAIMEGLANVIQKFINAPDAERLDLVKKRLVFQYNDDIEKTPEIGAWAIGYGAHARHRVEPRDSNLRAVEQVTIEDVAGAAKKYLGGPNVSVLYQGQLREDFPTHERFLELSMAAPRDLSMEARILGKRVKTAPAPAPGKAG